MYRSIAYFKGLDTLRFLAALSVVIHHSESMRLKNGLATLGPLSLLHNGHTAVIFFFVLSGFLITYLLLRERRRTGRVRVGCFYLRRVLRIWPLYWLLVLTGTLVVPAVLGVLGADIPISYTLGQTWGWFLLFLPGLVTFHYGHHLLEPLWSIGVEELFYLIWAPLFRFVRKHVLWLLLGVIGVKAALLALPLLTPMPEIYRFLVETYCFEAMAVGGLGAWWLFRARRPLSRSRWFDRRVQGAIYLLLGVYWCFNANITHPAWRALFDVPILSGLLVETMFLYLILGVAVAENGLIRLPEGVLARLGRISYGIYMYHTLVISAVIFLLKRYPFASPGLQQGVFYVAVIGGVIGVAGLSKRHFENYFLGLYR